MEQLTRLTKTDLQAIDYELAQVAPEAPTLDSLRAEGHHENTALVHALDWIADAGRVVTLLVAEMIQSAAALIIAVLFALLEYYRVKHGAEALGQADAQAALIAVAVVAANVVHPIYALRHLRGQSELHIQRATLRGYLESFVRRLFGKPQATAVDLYHNPALHLAASMITWTTVFLAVYDILGPLLNEIFTGSLTRPAPIAAVELTMGLGLSIAGVFFLQSAAHELGVRTLTDQPRRLSDVLHERQADHDRQLAVLRERVTSEYMARKRADQERKAAEKRAVEQLNTDDEDTEEVAAVRPT
jgi:hypothetical protein